MLINIADINNLFVNKEFEKAKELMTDYVNDNMNMDCCYDIYYRKVFGRGRKEIIYVASHKAFFYHNQAQA